MILAIKVQLHEWNKSRYQQGMQAFASLRRTAIKLFFPMLLALANDYVAGVLSVYRKQSDIVESIEQQPCRNVLCNVVLVAVRRCHLNDKVCRRLNESIGYEICSTLKTSV